MDFLSPVKNSINSIFQGKEPWQIVSITSSSVLLLVWFYNFLNEDETLLSRGKKTIFKLARFIPQIRARIDKELVTIKEDFKNEVVKRTSGLEYIVNLPSQGLAREEILNLLQKNLSAGQENWKNCLASGAVYVDSEELQSLAAETFKISSYTNPLHPELFPGVCKMEAEVIRMLCNLFHGDKNSCGSMTTGGTESIMMACKAYRDFAKETRGVKRPEIILPVTAHSGFDKAGLYLNIRLKHIKLDPQTYQVDVKSMKSAITRNTIMLVGSVPNFPYGTTDDIGAISNLGLKYNIPVHVDSCLGGLLTAFMAEAGYPSPITDFRLKGVTSISADTHKYGFAPKGTSVVMYREQKYHHHQFTVTTDWVGGVYASPTVNGSRSGGNIATCWSTLLYHGLDGYVEATKEIIYTTRFIEKGLRRINELFIFGQPATSVIAIGSDLFDIYRLSDAMAKLGWHLNVLQYPPGVHICITLMHTKNGISHKFLSDIRGSLGEILKEPNLPVEGKMALYGTAQKLPDRSIVADIGRIFLDSNYLIPDLNNIEE